MLEVLARPWPWYVAGPLIGLMVPAMILLQRRFGISTSLRHVCAATIPGKTTFFRYDWRAEGGWNLAFVAGVLGGGAFSAVALAGPETIALSDATRGALGNLGITDFAGLAPVQLFSFEAVSTVAGVMSMAIGGFLVGFGARVAGGCTSGHAITGMAELRASSLVAVCGFFAGGLATTYLVLPTLLAGLR